MLHDHSVRESIEVHDLVKTLDKHFIEIYGTAVVGHQLVEIVKKYHKASNELAPRRSLILEQQQNIVEQQKESTIRQNELAVKQQQVVEKQNEFHDKLEEHSRNGDHHSKEFQERFSILIRKEQGQQAMQETNSNTGYSVVAKSTVQHI